MCALPLVDTRMTPVQIHSAPRSFVRRPWYDYAGFFAFASLVVWNFWRNPTITALLIPTLGFDTLAALTFLMRDARVGRDPRWWAHVAAYGSGFLVPFATAAMGTWAPEWLERTTNPYLIAPGVILWTIGGTLKIWPLWHLRRAFSIEPAARRLVTTGPYRWARHPIYVGHIMVYLGILLLMPTLPFALVLILWFALTLIRIRAEDETLAAAFPEQHRVYRARIGALGPRITSRT